MELGAGEIVARDHRRDRTAIIGFENEVDVIAGYTSDGLIAKYDLVVLDDSRHAIG